MLQFDVFGLIPQSLKQRAIDTLVDFVFDQARNFAGDEIAGKDPNKVRIVIEW